MNCSSDCKMCEFILNELLTNIIDTKKCLICTKVLDRNNVTSVCVQCDCKYVVPMAKL